MAGWCTHTYYLVNLLKVQHDLTRKDLKSPAILTVPGVTSPLPPSLLPCPGAGSSSVIERITSSSEPKIIHGTSGVPPPAGVRERGVACAPTHLVSGRAGIDDGRADANRRRPGPDGPDGELVRGPSAPGETSAGVSYHSARARRVSFSLKV